MAMRPKLLFADDQGTIYDHPFLEMAGASGPRLVRPAPSDLVQLPAMSRLYFHPGCPPYGYDPKKRKIVLLAGDKNRPQNSQVQCRVGIYSAGLGAAAAAGHGLQQKKSHASHVGLQHRGLS